MFIGARIQNLIENLQGHLFIVPGEFLQLASLRSYFAVLEKGLGLNETRNDSVKNYGTNMPVSRNTMARTSTARKPFSLNETLKIFMVRS